MVEQPGVLRACGHHGVEGGQRLVGLFQVHQRDAKAVARAGIVGGNAQRVLQKARSIFVAALLHPHQAQIVMRAEQARIGIQDLPIERFGACEIALLMDADGLFGKGLEVRHSC